VPPARAVWCYYEMANPDHLPILNKGVDYWNKWRRMNPTVRRDLFEAVLMHKYIPQVDFSDADLRKADIGEADLRHANLSKADLIAHGSGRLT